jgi:hypothetical protein
MKRQRKASQAMLKAHALRLLRQARKIVAVLGGGGRPGAASKF